MKLNFRLIKDDALNLNDRIIFSFAWKWAWWNYKRKKAETPPKAITVYRFRKATGFRHTTIKASLLKLKDRGYLSDALTPILPKKHASYLGYRKLSWHSRTFGIRFQIFYAMAETNTKQVSAAWWAKALGINRQTYYRWHQIVATDETRPVTGVASKPLRM